MKKGQGVHGKDLKPAEILLENERLRSELENVSTRLNLSMNQSVIVENLSKKVEQYANMI